MTSTTISAARIWAEVGGIFRSSADAMAGEVDALHRYEARSVQSSLAVGASSQPGDLTRKDRSRANEPCMLQRTLGARVDAVESDPRRRASPPRITSRSSAGRKLPLGTSSRLVREGARRRMRGWIRPCLQDVDDVGMDRRQGVDGLGDEPVDGAQCRSVVP
jgi:hypothetical protein